MTRPSTPLQTPASAALPVRLNYEAQSLADVTQYLQTRGLQLLTDGYVWSGQVAWAEGFEGQAYETHYKRREDAEPRSVCFVLPHARGKGVMRQLVKQGRKLVTVPSCGIESILRHLGADYHLGGAITNTLEYQLVQDFYGNDRAARSKVFLMNHIDEGLAVMALVGATSEAMRAFCLHPLIQDDNGFATYLARLAQVQITEPSGAYVLALAVEYRSVANEYLANVGMRPGGIRLSPIKDVNDMLIGDKVQNRKDFELYHKGTHRNSDRLTEYFQQWCGALGVADDYDALRAHLPA